MVTPNIGTDRRIGLVRALEATSPLHTFTLTAKITLDPRFKQTGDFQPETAEALQIILGEKIEKLNRGLLLKITDVKVEYVRSESVK